MGYDTNYKIDFNGDLADEYPDGFDFVDDIMDMIENGSWEGTWYEWKEDMKKLSTFHPDILFTLNGDGVETPDIWRAYFLGGKCQHEKAKIVFGEFDAGKLND